MKYQQVSVDFVNMVFTACTYLALAGAAWILLRLLQACFWLPRHLKQQNSMQKMLQDKVDGYEKYIQECEIKEREAAEQQENGNLTEKNDESKKIIPIDEEKWKERRECLEMLKKELKRVNDGGDPYDWNHLLEEDEDENNALTDENENNQNETKSTTAEESLNDQSNNHLVEGVENKKDK